MKIMFSRKGFDTEAGGVPSPIFPDGRLLSLPIPDKNATLKYQDIKWNEYNLGKIVSSLANGKIKPYYSAHLDPDINPQNLSRHEQWKPLLGQVNAAQGHLRKQDIKPGDMFIFFGLFREIEIHDATLRFKTNTLRKHAIWGWLQIEEVIPVDIIDKENYRWAFYHPHFNRKPDKTNTVYIAKKYLDIPGIGKRSVAGAGIFSHFSERLQLTAPHSKKPSIWQLPQYFFPSCNKPPLTYHSDLKRWKKKGDYVLLDTVGRGQEFVLDCVYYPETTDWILNLFNCCET